jgi:phosphate uptake regulator
MNDTHLIEIYPHVWRQLVEADLAHPSDINAVLLIALAQRDTERVFDRTHDH